MFAEADLYWFLVWPSARWRHFCRIGVRRFFVFSKTTARIFANFFSWFRWKHLLITTCCEKHCPALNSWHAFHLSDVQTVPQELGMQPHSLAIFFGAKLI